MNVIDSARTQCGLINTARSLMDRAPPSSTCLATTTQRRYAMLIGIAIILVTMGFTPMAKEVWPRIPAFFPAYQTAATVVYFITGYMILGHFRVTNSLNLLYLSGGCFYTAGILAIQFWTIPEMFTEYKTLLGGDQTGIWLCFLWHAGSVSGVLMYVLSEWRWPDHMIVDVQTVIRRFYITIILLLAGSITAVTVFHDWLPVLDVDGNLQRTVSTGIAPLLQLITILTLLLLWRVTHFRTVLQVWLGIALIAFVCDNAITMIGGSRLSVGWYIGCFNALVSIIVLLIICLYEIHQVYLKTAADARLLAASHALLEVRIDQARLDDLTGLPGRILFFELAEALRLRHLGHGLTVAVLFIDLDGFKWINDQKGHERGDAVLIAVAQTLRSVLREIDVAGRIGGDEFVVCLAAPMVTMHCTVTAIAERIIAKVAAIGDGISCSIGVALCDAIGLEWGAVLRQADEAMYSAKRRGKCQFAIYSHACLDKVVE